MLRTLSSGSAQTKFHFARALAMARDCLVSYQGAGRGNVLTKHEFSFLKIPRVCFHLQPASLCFVFLLQHSAFWAPHDSLWDLTCSGTSQPFVFFFPLSSPKLYIHTHYIAFKYVKVSRGEWSYYSIDPDL